MRLHKNNIKILHEKVNYSWVKNKQYVDDFFVVAKKPDR